MGWNGDRIIYSCLRVAVRQVTLDTWMELLVATASLSKEEMRRKLCERLVDFLYELQPVQYQDAMEKLKTVWIQVIEDKDMLVRVVVALINKVRLVGFGGTCSTLWSSGSSGGSSLLSYRLLGRCTSILLLTGSLTWSYLGSSASPTRPAQSRCHFM